MDRDIYISDESKNAPLLIMQISAKDGSQSHIYVGENDDAEQLAGLFCKVHGLPEQVIPRVASQVNNKREIALEARKKQQQEQRQQTLESPRSQTRSEGLQSSSNQLFFERLHGYADYHKHRKEALEANIKRERLNDIESKSFRHTIGHIANSPSHRIKRSVSADRVRSSDSANGASLHEQIYENHQAWAAKREAELEKQRKELELQEEERINSCTFQPKLIAKRFVKEDKYGARKDSVSDQGSDLFHTLHNKHTEITERRLKKKEQLDAERAQDITGKPTLIATRSPRLAAKRRARRDELASSIGGYDSDSTLGYSSLPSSRGGRFRFSGANDDDYTFSDADSSRGFSRSNSRPSSAPSQNAGFGDPLPFSTQHQFSPGAMSLQEFLSPEPVPGTARSYGVEAPVVRLSQSGIEERSAMSQSINRRSNSGTPGGIGDGSSSPSPRRSGRSNSPSGRSVGSVGSKSLSLFDSLYQARHESSAKRMELSQKYSLRHSHTPDIGINTLKEVEGTKEEFVQRLFDHRHYQENLRRYNAHQTFVGEMGRDISADPVLGAKATADLIHRLTVLDPEARKQRSASLSSSISSGIESKKESKFITSKSEKIARSARNKAFSEIFDVMVMSADFTRQLPSTVDESAGGLPSSDLASGANSPDTSHLRGDGMQPAPEDVPLNNSEIEFTIKELDVPTSSNASAELSNGSVASRSTSNSNIQPQRSDSSVASHDASAAPTTQSRSSRSISPHSRKQYIGTKRADLLATSPVPRSAEAPNEQEALLEIELARPFLLENPHLADAISKILRQAHSIGLRKISRSQFLAVADACIEKGVVIPINFILSSVSHNGRRDAPETSDDLETKKCTSIPTELPAKKVNEKLIKNRYKLRVAGLQKVEDSLREYGDYQLSRSQQLRGKVRADEMKECTFSPELITRTSWSKAKAAADRKRVVEEFYRQSILPGSQKAKVNGVEPPRRSIQSPAASSSNNKPHHLSRNVDKSQGIHGGLKYSVPGGGANERPAEIVIPSVEDTSEDVSRSVKSVREMLSKSSLTPAGRTLSGTRTNEFAENGRSSEFEHSAAAGSNVPGFAILPVKDFSQPRPYFEQNVV